MLFLSSTVIKNRRVIEPGYIEQIQYIEYLGSCFIFFFIKKLNCLLFNVLHVVKSITTLICSLTFLQFFCTKNPIFCLILSKIYTYICIQNSSSDISSKNYVPSKVIIFVIFGLSQDSQNGGQRHGWKSQRAGGRLPKKV